MRILGLNILTGKIHYAVLEGTKNNPAMIEKSRLGTIDSGDLPAFIDWTETTLGNLLDRVCPDKLAYRLSTKPTIDQQLVIDFPYGILNLIAFRKQILIERLITQNFVASKLALPRGTDLYKKCEEVFGPNPPYWDKNMKNAVLAAWIGLPK